MAFLPVFQLFPVCGVPVGGWCGVAALRRSDGSPFLSRIIYNNKVRRTTERVGKGAEFGQKRGFSYLLLKIYRNNSNFFMFFFADTEIILTFAM